VARGKVFSGSPHKTVHWVYDAVWIGWNSSPKAVKPPRPSLRPYLVSAMMHLWSLRGSNIRSDKQGLYRTGLLWKNILIEASGGNSNLCTVWCVWWHSVSVCFQACQVRTSSASSLMSCLL
jgi:hypothetical protein